MQTMSLLVSTIFINFKDIIIKADVELVVLLVVGKSLNWGMVAYKVALCSSYFYRSPSITISGYFPVFIVAVTTIMEQAIHRVVTSKGSIMNISWITIVGNSESPNLIDLHV